MNLKLGKTTYSGKQLTSFILTIMLWLNLFIALFPANNGSILWRFLSGESAYTGVWIRLLTFINFGGSILILLLNRRMKASIILMYFILLYGAFFISKTLNLYQGDLLGLIGIPIEYLVFYIIIKNFSLKHQVKYILPLLALWIIVPLLLFLFGPMSMKLSFISIDPVGRVGTYGGFALHRNYLGYYIGLIIIMVLYSQTNKYFKIITTIIGVVAIFVSTSRSASVCLMIALAVYGWYSLKKWRIPFFILIGVLGGVYYVLSTQIQIRQTDITNTSARENLIIAFKDSIADSPILGKGRDTRIYSTTYPNGAQAHNFVSQVWSDYGIFTLFFFICFWGSFYFLGNKVVKTYISYLISFGLFQPYFMLCIPPPFIWLNILFISCSANYPRFKDKYLKLRYEKPIKE